MRLEKGEYLWRMVNEHMTQARHQEVMRFNMTTLLLTLAGVVIGFITYDKELTCFDLVPACLLFLLGLFGVLFSAKHYERFNFHIARVRMYRQELERNFINVNWKKIREEADVYHEARFPRLVRQRQNLLWLVLHGINALIGVVFIIAICIRNK
jgi:hypothetical protein